MRRLVVCAWLVAFLSGAAWAQDGREKYPMLEEEDAAFASMRTPYQGYEPFVIVQLPPYGEPEWFSLSFFMYWTGYGSTGDAKPHWVVRKISGARGKPGKLTWAVSDTCPELERAIGQFSLSQRISLHDGTQAPFLPPWDKDHDVVQLYHPHSGHMSFWARLDAQVELEINLAGQAGYLVIAPWVFDIVKATASCFREAAPVLPALSDEVKAMRPPSLSIFRHVDEDIADAARQ